MEASGNKTALLTTHWVVPNCPLKCLHLSLESGRVSAAAQGSLLFLLGGETTLCKTPHFQWIYGKLVWPNGPKICARRTKTDFKDRVLHNEFVMGIFWWCSFLTNWTLNIAQCFACSENLLNVPTIFISGNIFGRRRRLVLWNCACSGKQRRKKERIQLHALERKKKESLVQFWAVWPASPFSARGLDGEQQF